MMMMKWKMEIQTISTKKRQKNAMKTLRMEPKTKINTSWECLFIVYQYLRVKHLV